MSSPTSELEMDEYESLKNDFTTLSSLQNLLFGVFDNDDLKREESIDALFSYFNEIEIESKYMIYEAFILMLTQSSMSRPSKSQEIIELSQKIIDELITKHNLKNSFHVSTIASIFSRNRALLLYLNEKKLLKKSTIIRSIMNCHDYDAMLFFYPEIQNRMISLRISDMFHKNFGVYYGDFTKQYDDIELNRKMYHSNDELAQIIQNDDIDAFITFCGKYNIDLNSQINLTCYELIPILQCCDTKVSLLEYSMIFAAINVFKFLLAKQVDYDQNSLKYSIIGGNSEIINIIINESHYKFDHQCLEASIACFRPDITSYIEYHMGNNVPKYQLIRLYYQYYDFASLNDYLKDIFRNIPITNYLMENNNYQNNLFLWFYYFSQFFDESVNTCVFNILCKDVN
ncbi:hypothetical protein TRFO_30854 [Tritrichomonas foetus]|uniref:DUF3447 domain-containing protein n=1 Tax=Tritrichomonas foetus TaxID=1144522 RepID=A0A1J4JSP6_9EUKA|nr:hypothetical protein TRFO_30854 [Tritrichomonas foetus]|eukprot:OHT02151.1 hypothetical protein TRFO_30854 [Tritrichomonas foetus]